MRTRYFNSLIAFFIASTVVLGQPALHFKTRSIQTTAAAPVTELRSPVLTGPGHLLVQFDEQPTPEIVAELGRRGVHVLQDVPENGLLVTVDRPVATGDLRIRFAAPIDAADKISPLLKSASTANEYFLAEFHPDTDMAQARATLSAKGIEMIENPDLNPHHLLIRALDSRTIDAITVLDEVAYVFPASNALVNGTPTGACVGALTVTGAAAQSIPIYGTWQGVTGQPVTIGYVFTTMTEQLAPSAAQAQIERAMSIWSNAIQVTWKQGTNATAPQTVSILWGTYAHGDAYPFDGPGGVLAHTFFPSPTDPEPIAGDMHFDDSETWRIGLTTDLFSVALHELGHALGLGHSDDPNAVMYPYYQQVTQLSALDVSTIQTMYAAQTSAPVTPPAPAPVPTPTPTPAPTATPLTMAVNSTVSSTTATTIALNGTVSGGTGTVAISWSTTGSNGTAAINGSTWSIASVPLVVGSNTITITAANSVTHVSQSVMVTRTTVPTPAPTPAPAPTPTPTPTPTPGSTDTTAPSLTIASPSSTSIGTSAATIAFSGTSSDNVGVKTVTWATNTGGSGTATGTTQWSATIPLLVGSNTVTVKAADAAGNVGWRSVVVTRY